MGAIITVHEAAEVCKKGVIALPVHMGQVHGRLEKEDCPRPKFHNGKLRLPSGREIPWTPANKIGW